MTATITTDITIDKAPVRRVARLFRPYRWSIAVLLLISVAQGAAGVASPFMVREIVDRALPQRSATLVVLYSGGMIAAAARRRGPRRRLDPPLERDRPGRDARPPGRRLRPPATDVARLLHPDPGRRTAVADRERHRRRGQRRDQHGQLGRSRRHRRPHRRCRRADHELEARDRLPDRRPAVPRLLVPARPAAAPDRPRPAASSSPASPRWSRNPFRSPGVLLAKTPRPAARAVAAFQRPSPARCRETEVDAAMNGKWVLAAAGPA